MSITPSHLQPFDTLQHVYVTRRPLSLTTFFTPFINVYLFV